jgi:hypothetical protein
MNCKKNVLAPLSDCVLASGGGLEDPRALVNYGEHAGQWAASCSITLFSSTQLCVIRAGRCLRTLAAVLTDALCSTQYWRTITGETGLKAASDIRLGRL